LLMVVGNTTFHLTKRSPCFLTDAAFDTGIPSPSILVI
jgi:hypothetical protein